MNRVQRIPQSLNLLKHLRHLILFSELRTAKSFVDDHFPHFCRWKIKHGILLVAMWLKEILNVSWETREIKEKITSQNFCRFEALCLSGISNWYGYISTHNWVFSNLSFICSNLINMILKFIKYIEHKSTASFCHR